MSQETTSSAAAAGEAQPVVLMLLTNAYDPDPRVRQEALALIRLGYRVKLLAWDRDRKSPAHACMEGVEIERVFLQSRHGRGNTQLFFYAWLYLKMLWRGWKNKFDVVHCHDLDTLPLGFLIGKLKGKPIVYDAHESFPDMLEGSVHPLVRRGVDWLESLLIGQVDLLITVGEKLRRHLAQKGARHTVVVGNWKRPEDFSRTQAETIAIRRQLGIPDSALTVVCITQLLTDRKLEELLEALNGTDVYLIIGGKGVLETLVTECAAKNPRIKYVGFARGKQIGDYTCAADIVYYGFDPGNPNARFSAPNKLYEALAAGKPLITGDFGEIAEVVRQAQCGIVLPEYTAAEVRKALDAMSEPAVRTTFAANAARAGATGLNWARGEEVLDQEYAALVGNTPQPIAIQR